MNFTCISPGLMDNFLSVTGAMVRVIENAGLLVTQSDMTGLDVWSVNVLPGMFCMAAGIAA